MLSDLRYVIRTLRQRPGYTAVTVSVLALGVGPTAAILSLANQLVFRPIPHVQDPGRLALVYFAQWSNQGRGMSPRSVSNLNREEIVAGTPALEGLAGYQPTAVSIAAENTAPRQVSGLFADGDFFRLLGLSPELGRAFGPEEDRPPDGTPVVVISHDFWTSQFNRDPQVLGRTLRVNGEPFTIVGVAPQGFKGIESLSNTEVWLPAATLATVSHIPPQFRPQGRGFGWFYAFLGRLAPEATFQQAEAQLRAAVTRVVAAYPEENAALGEAQPRVFPGLGVFVLSRASARDTLRLLAAVGAVLLLIACANVANLALFRAAQRRGETAIRRALGAGAVRVAGLYFTESVLLGLVGGGIGLLLAVWLARLFEGSSFTGIGKIPDLSLDWRVVGLTAGVSVAAGLLFGVAPALFARRLDLSVALKDAARTGTAARPWLRAGLSALQLTLCLTLLVAAFLFIGTLRNLYRVDLGFDPSEVAMFQIDLAGRGYTQQQAGVYYENLLQRMGHLRGVSSASVSQLSPLLGVRHMAEVQRPDEDPQAAHPVVLNAVSSGYLDALRMTLVRGRWFTEEETLQDVTAAVHPMVISQALAHQLFGDQDPVGRVVSFPARERRPRSDHVVVGAARDVRWIDPTEEPDAIVYLPLSSPESMDRRWAVLLVRSPVPLTELAPAVRDVAAGLDNTVALSEAQLLTAVLEARVAQQRMFAKMLGLLSALAVLLAAAGVYGLVSQTVVERTREFGIRMAVGAERRDVLALVMKRAGLLAVWGVLGGLAGAAVIGRVIRSRLYGVQPLDPLVYALALAALVGVTLVASYLPARRGARANPVAALRAE